MKRRISLKSLRKRAESAFHKWIVKRDKFCFTCGKLATQAGHFRHGKLDFDEQNLNGSCTYCNCWLHGNLGVYAVRLDDRYGTGTAAALILRANQTENKYDREFLENILKKYSE